MISHLLFALLWIVGCQPLPPRPPAVERLCSATCDRYRALHCAEGDPSPVKGITCEQVCLRSEFYEPLPHACIQSARTCAAARSCEQ